MNRTLCRCRDCESVYAARKPTDQPVRIIGTDAGCPCGSDALYEMTRGSFSKLDESAT
ncbi:hypothetical protein [Haloprofundus halophilus]|uniref:hypothetical protein n=1 Tax=Haloprofundus halophilus TaxID=2283527 RepID=UPI001300B1A0|nr:hypothetical protein [Haloprofundus halophilus]